MATIFNFFSTKTSGLGLRGKLVGIFFLSAVICVGLIYLTSILKSRSALKHLSNNQLDRVHKIKKHQVESFFKDFEGFSAKLAQDCMTEEITLAYGEAFYGSALSIGEDANIIGLNSFEHLHKTYLARAKRMADAYGVANFYVAQTNGQIVFGTDERSALLGKNLVNGSLKETKLAKCVQEASSGKIAFSDYEYFADLNRSVAFTCVAQKAEFDYSLKKGLKVGDVIGTVILELNPKKLEAVLDLKGTLGKTGHNYILGSDGKLRSDWMIASDDFKFDTFFKSPNRKMTSNTIDLIVSGKVKELSAVQEQSANGKRVVMAASPLSVLGQKWFFFTEQEVEEFYADATSVTRSLTLLISVITLVVAGLALLAVYVFTSMIVSSLQRVTDAASAMARGNFDFTLPDTRSQDEIGKMVKSFLQMAQTQRERANIAEKIANKDFNQNVMVYDDGDILGKALKKMTDELNAIMIRIKESSEKVSAGMAQLNSVSESISQGATETAASLEEISSTMTEINSQAASNAQNAIEANSLAISSRQAAENGKQLIESTVNAMGEINESSKQIDKIIKVIDDIAFQTNLLSLNAAVEAARAGKYGKGFAVVADEVRNLASNSAKAAGETAELIESASKKITYGLNEAKKTAESFQGIYNNTTKLTTLVSEIAAASREQSNGLSQATEGMSQIDKVTQSNTASAEETASAARELLEQAKELNNLLQDFNLRGTKASSGLVDSLDNTSDEVLVHQSSTLETDIDPMTAKVASLN